jgi:hypothetical protein
MVEPLVGPVGPRQVPGVLGCELPEELLLTVPGGSAVVALNASARAIWELCDGHHSLETIADELAARFDATPGELRAAVHDVVLELAGRQLIVLPEAPGATADP